MSSNKCEIDVSGNDTCGISDGGIDESDQSGWPLDFGQTLLVVGVAIGTAVILTLLAAMTAQNMKKSFNSETNLDIKSAIIVDDYQASDLLASDNTKTLEVYDYVPGLEL